MHVIIQSCFLSWLITTLRSVSAEDPVRLVGLRGAGRCAGVLEMKHQRKWRPVIAKSGWSLKPSDAVCRRLNCGSAVSTRRIPDVPYYEAWSVCVGSEAALMACGSPDTTYYSMTKLEVICSESVRLVNGTSLCSGRVEVKSDQLWLSVCEGDFDQQDAEVVCRELGCGAPSVLQGALYSEGKATMGTKDFQCEGSESVLLDCRTSDSTRNTCSPDKTVGLTCSGPDDVRLAGGSSHCTGILEMKHEGEWRPVLGWSDWHLKTSVVLCKQLKCGAAISTERWSGDKDKLGWKFRSSCDGSESSLRECGTKQTDTSTYILDVVCSESVRLVNGDNLCSGRVEVKSNQSWVSVCEGDFDQQDAEVVCRELGCGAPSVLQGALYGEVKAPMWTKEIQCEGSESLFQDCVTSDSTRNTCSPDKTVGLTCSVPDDVRLVGGTSHCNGILETKHHRQWRPVSTPYTRAYIPSEWNLQSSAVLCRQLGCGSVVSTERTYGFTSQSVWRFRSLCDGSESSLRECGTKMSDKSTERRKVICSESVRFVNGNNLCSGRVEVKSDQSWVSVCEGDFDQQDAEVVCRELSCGAPSVLQGALYGEGKAPMSTKAFQCDGNESVLLDCGTSDSTRDTCLPDKSVGLTCSGSSVRLVGGTSHCTGTLEMKHLDEWRPVGNDKWNLRSSAVVCREMDCGSVVSTGRSYGYTSEPSWQMSSVCDGSESSLSGCGEKDSFSTSYRVEVMCSESVRLVNGTSLCSGRVEVMSNQSWVSVCEGDFDQQDAEVVCRQLGCGPPSLLLGSLYGEVKAPMLTKEFQCEGDQTESSESVLQHCETSSTNTCSPNKMVRLSCSEPEDIRLVGGTSHCTGILEMKHQGEWRPAFGTGWNLKTKSVVCRQLGCGSAVPTERTSTSTRQPVWWIRSNCDGSEYSLRECVSKDGSDGIAFRLVAICSDLLFKPKINVFPSRNGASEGQQQGVQVFKGSSYIISCSIQPQYPGGSFHLTFIGSNTTHNHSQPAVNYYANFLFGIANHTQEGKYSCVYRINVFEHDFYSESEFLSLAVTELLFKPNINVFPFRTGVSGGHQQGLQVGKGSDITISCSIQPQYPGGSFHLTFTGSNTTHSHIKPAVNHFANFLLTAADHTHQGSYSCVYHINVFDHNFFSESESLSLAVTDLLFRPNINVFPSRNRVSEGHQQGLQVSNGINFTVSCSIQPQYPGGSFQLTFTGSNTTHNHTQPAVNHYANFLFLGADHTHQGNYSCVYHINVFNHNFSSESETLSLTVTDGLNEMDFMT